MILNLLEGKVTCINVPFLLLYLLECREILAGGTQEFPEILV